MLKGVGAYRVQGQADGQRKISLSAAAIAPKSNGTMMSRSEVKAGLEYPSLLGGAGSTTGATPTTAIQGQYYKPLLDGMIFTDEKKNRELYRDIYYHDPIAGSAVDLLSQIPFSGFSLSGLPDQEMTDTFADSCEALNVQTLFPEATIDYLVNGQFIASFNYDDDKKRITSIIPQDSNNCEVTPVPAYGTDPVIDVTVPKSFIEFVQRAKTDQRLAQILDNKLDDLQKMAAAKQFPLDPKYTLFIPRRTFPTNVIGTSFYRRILPIWLLEKALTRGTIDLSYRRQKSVLHIMAGDDEWEATDQQLSQIVQLFLQADMDPTGAIVATRPGIMTQEVRMASDFWKIEDSYGIITDMKLRGLNISESFLTGEAVLTTMDTTLSVLLEMIRAHRDMMTRRVFYQKVFPLIAVENGFKIEDKKYMVTSAVNRGGNYGYVDEYTNQYTRVIASGTQRAYDTEDFNAKDYYMPKISWFKSLKPEADQEYLNILNELSDKGMPVTIRMLAAASGLSLPDIMAQLEDDVKIRHKIAEFQKRMPKTLQQQADEMGFVGSSADLAPVLAHHLARQQQQPAPKKNRDFTPLKADRRDPDTNRPVMTRQGREILDQRANKLLARLVSRSAQAENDKLRRARSNRANGKTTIYSK